MKAKLSVTVDSVLVDELDRVSGKGGRSEIVEKALTRWLREHRLRELDSEIERYYREMSKEERSEDEEWAELAATGMSETWS